MLLAQCYLSASNIPEPEPADPHIRTASEKMWINQCARRPQPLLFGYPVIPQAGTKPTPLPPRRDLERVRHLYDITVLKRRLNGGPPQKIWAKQKPAKIPKIGILAGFRVFILLNRYFDKPAQDLGLSSYKILEQIQYIPY
jgi:hypothetical protein